MRNEVVKRIPQPHDVDARSRMKSRFDLFSQTLPKEADLFASWSDSNDVVVSIACATFDHGDLLDDAIRSFLLQDTSFRFEIVIRDDASTDGTRDLISSYVTLYPRIIRAKVYEENQFKLGRRPIHDWIELTRGKFIALCEGDDFWIDQDKLQDQVTQLERHPDCVISVAGTLSYEVKKNDLQEFGLVEEERIFHKPTPQYHHTSSLVIERGALGNVVAKMEKYSVFGDTALRRLLVDEGKCISLPRLVSVYWKDGFGIWTSLSIEEMSKEHVLIFARLIRPLKYLSKLSVLPFLLRACSAYFSIALRRKEWLFAAACSAPYLVIKALDLSRRVGRRLCIRHKV